MSLEQAFYIIAIITMSLGLLLMIALVTAVFVIKSKINHLHHVVVDKAQTLAGVAAGAKNFFHHKK